MVLTVQHNSRQYANSKTGAHINTAEDVDTVLQRTPIDVYHRSDRKHFQQDIVGIIWQRGHRVPKAKVRKQKSSTRLALCGTTME